jgi:hypothetical protein
MTSKPKYEIVGINNIKVIADVSLSQKKEELFFNATLIAKQDDKKPVEWIYSTQGSEYIAVILEVQNFHYENLVSTVQDGSVVYPGFGDNSTTENKFSTDTKRQRAAILTWLQTATITTLQAREELDIMHPAARIKELRAQGHNIAMRWTTADTGKAKHRIARYALLPQG